MASIADMDRINGVDGIIGIDGKKSVWGWYSQCGRDNGVASMTS
jgi:hypothetical protein